MPVRLDKFLVDHGFVASRERATAMVLAGRVLVNEQKASKAGMSVAEDAMIRLLGNDIPFVSRGGLKLQAALQYWNIELAGRWGVDIGASTGGFTDCMLQAGAAGVVAVDTGYGQMAVPLRDDSRLRLLERCNARHLQPGSLLNEARELALRIRPDSSFSAPDFLAMDVSFISATLVLPAVLDALAASGTAWQGESVVLVKPQFEAGREWVGKGGIVRDSRAHTYSIDRVTATLRERGAAVSAAIDSPITGAEGNREFLLHAVFPG